MTRYFITIPDAGKICSRLGLSSANVKHSLPIQVLKILHKRSCSEHS